MDYSLYEDQLNPGGYSEVGFLAPGQKLEAVISRSSGSGCSWRDDGATWVIFGAIGDVKRARRGDC